VNTNVFIFQEQIIKTVQMIAGYSDQEAESFRRMISKKKKDKVAAEKSKFISKMMNKGYSETQGEDLWNEMESFSSYAFNKSHAVGYSYITAKTAYLKYNFPVEFYVANIMQEINDIDKVSALIDEATKFGISLTPPNINYSNEYFTVLNDKTILYGLAGIVGIGVAAAQAIVEERIKNGQYKSLSDFIIRTNVRSNMAVNLAKAGCFDDFLMRAQALYEYEDGSKYIERLIDFIKHVTIKSPGTYLYLPEEEWLPLPSTLEFDKLMLSRLESEVTGMPLSLNYYQINKEIIEYYKSKNKTNSKNTYCIATIDRISNFKNGSQGVFIKTKELSNKAWFGYDAVYKFVAKHGLKKFEGQKVIIGYTSKNDEINIIYDICFADKYMEETTLSKIEIKVTNNYNALSIIKSLKPIKTSLSKLTGNKAVVIVGKNDTNSFTKTIGFLNT